jgi:hypothetical protein
VSTKSKSKLLACCWFHGAFQQGATKQPEDDGRCLAQSEMVVVIMVNVGLLGNCGMWLAWWTTGCILVLDPKAPQEVPSRATHNDGKSKCTDKQWMAGGYLS